MDSGTLRSDQSDRCERSVSLGGIDCLNETTEITLNHSDSSENTSLLISHRSTIDEPKLLRNEPTNDVQSEINRIISEAHNSIVEHFGIHKTRQTLSKSNQLSVIQSLYSGDINTAITNFIKQCPVCQKIRLGQGDIGMLPASTVRYEPFECTAVDTLGPLPIDEDHDGNCYLICIIDCFSRFIELVPAKDATALAVAKALLQIFGRYCLFQEIQSDGPPQYAAEVIENF